MQARSLFLGAVKELGISLGELAKRSEISSPGVGYSVEREKPLHAKTDIVRLIFSYFFSSLPIYDKPSPMGTRL